MNLIPIALAVLWFLTFLSRALFSRQVRLLRVSAALTLVAFAVFCTFGFIAAGELTETLARHSWRAGYLGSAAGSLLGAFYFMRHGLRESHS